MSMTLVDAKTYVAQIFGGTASQESLDMAGTAIRRAYSDWQIKHYWKFLLKDTSNATSVSASAAANGATLFANGTMIALAALDFVNIGQTVTYSGSTGSLAANTTVLSYTRNSDGTIATVVLSNAVTGIGTTEAGTFTFSADIPIVAGTQDYNLPTDFFAAYTARTITNPRTLTWRDQRYWDRIIVNQTVRGFPAEYTTYNPISDETQNFGTQRLKLDVIPQANDTLRLRYYREFNQTGTYIDVPDQFLYPFLDYARGVLLATKKAADDPAAFLQSATQGAEASLEQDQEPTEDNDMDSYLKSQYEMGPLQRNLWNNGEFWPYNY